MNKKFSTLVATLLVAGAGMTLNAEVIKVTAPKVGGSYLIGLTVTEGVADNGEIGGLLKIATGGTTLDATIDAAAAYQAVGGEWALSKAEVTGVKDAFYLVKDGKYICAADPAAGKTLEVSSDDAKKANRIAFVITGGKIVVAKAIDANIAAGDELSIAAGVVTLVATTTGTAVEFATYQADKEVSFGTEKSDLVASQVKDTYYFIAAEDGKLLYLSAENATATAADASGAASTDVAKYLWKVTESTVGTTTQYTFENKAFPGKFATIGKTTAFTASGKYNNGVGLFVGANSVDADFGATGTADAAIAFGFYEAIQLPYTVKELKADLGGSFALTIADADKTEGTNVFDGNLVPMGTTAFDDPATDDANATYYRLQSGEKFVVLNTKNIWAGNVGNEALKRGAKFELVEKDDLSNADYLSYFKISHTSGNDASKNLQVEVLNADQSVYGRLFVISAGDKKYLTTSVSKADNETWVSVQRGASNIVDVKTLLGKFWNISYAESKEAAKEQKEEYKLNGVLVPFTEKASNSYAPDYVDASTVLLSSPETQWAVIKADATTNTFTLKNRESSASIGDVVLRTTNTPNVYYVQSQGLGADEIKGDSIKLMAVTKVDKFDGYMKTTPNALRNQVFNIGQYHNATGNVDAYWAENHQSNGTHQLGVVTEGAVDWRLSLDTKADPKKNTEVDTVYVVTKLAKWDGSKIENEATADTLVVLPYLFQNKANLEYVKYKEEGFNYYVCDETPDVKDNGERFALKVKPNGYNIVVMDVDGGVKGLVGSDKVYASNSVKWGALNKMWLYSKDDNSIMVVEEVAKPEYRKVAKEWGDVVKIYREEYPTEVLFEKADAKSVVDNDTLSFLNVNNSVTGANPALFIDTAYVNRVDADGIKNTCYQYLLGVNVDKDDTYYCPYNPEHNSQTWRDEHNGGKPCADAMEHRAVKGRFLINLVDTAFAYKQEHLHNNPYVNNVEANENLAKLSFVEGIHANDTLYITRKGGEVVKLAMDSADFNVAKFAFRYVDNNAGSFKIQTQYKHYTPSAAQTLKELEDSATNEGYLRWVNGTIVVTGSYLNGETFNMDENYNGNPVSNEDVNVSAISVVATNGGVIIKGAAGKKVTISNVLGQTVANTVISSDDATISAPAGVVVVAVEGEAAVKAIVK